MRTKSWCAPRRQGGVSLFEVILAVVVVGIAVSALAITFTTTVVHSADPMIRRQAQLIAEAYLEEILLKRFYDPNTNTVCPAPEGSRNLYDNVCDYNALNEPPKDQFGNPIGALSAYNVAVAVTSAGVTLNALDNTSVTKVLRVDVTVTGPNNTSIALSGYRTNYNCDALGDPGCKP